MGMRGRNSPVLSWQVRPAWKPKTWEEKKEKPLESEECKSEGPKGKSGTWSATYKLLLLLK